MPPSRDPLNPAEHERLRVLGLYGIVDTPPEPAYERIVAEAARAFGVSAAALTFVTEDRCWFKAQLGLGIGSVPRNFGLCSYAFCSSGTLVIADAERTPPFQQVPLVTKVGFRFYAGAPLLTPEGVSLGTLCVLDRTPRQPTPEQLATLRTLAQEALTLLATRRRELAGAVVAPEPITPRARRTVLVVDDEESIRTFVASVFRFRGVTALGAADATAALALYQQHAAEIGLVLTDIHMPGKSGLELIDELRREANPPAITAMSGRLDGSLQRALAGLGVSVTLAKPFGLAEFDRLIALLPAPVAVTAPA